MFDRTRHILQRKRTRLGSRCRSAAPSRSNGRASQRRTYAGVYSLVRAVARAMAFSIPSADAAIGGAFGAAVLYNDLATAHNVAGLGMLATNSCQFICFGAPGVASHHVFAYGNDVDPTAYTTQGAPGDCTGVGMVLAGCPGGVVNSVFSVTLPPEINPRTGAFSSPSTVRRTSVFTEISSPARRSSREPEPAPRSLRRRPERWCRIPARGKENFCWKFRRFCHVRLRRIGRRHARLQQTLRRPRFGQLGGRNASERHVGRICTRGVCGRRRERAPETRQRKLRKRLFEVGSLHVLQRCFVCGHDVRLHRSAVGTTPLAVSYEKTSAASITVHATASGTFSYICLGA